MNVDGWTINLIDTDRRIIGTNPELKIEKLANFTSGECISIRKKNPHKSLIEFRANVRVFEGVEGTPGSAATRIGFIQLLLSTTREVRYKTQKQTKNSQINVALVDCPKGSKPTRYPYYRTLIDDTIYEAKPIPVAELWKSGKKTSKVIQSARMVAGRRMPGGAETKTLPSSIQLKLETTDSPGWEPPFHVSTRKNQSEGCAQSIVFKDVFRMFLVIESANGTYDPLCAWDWDLDFSFAVYKAPKERFEAAQVTFVGGHPKFSATNSAPATEEQKIELRAAIGRNDVPEELLLATSGI